MPVYAVDGPWTESGKTTHVAVLGGFSVAVDGRDVTPTGVPALLLKALALGGAMDVPALLEVLWPGVDASVGRTRLRGVLARLRRACGDIVERRGESIALSRSVGVDAVEFCELAEQTMECQDRAQAVELAGRAWSLHGGDVLPFDTSVDWTAGFRERVRRRAAEVLDVLAEDAVARGRAFQAITYLEHAMELEAQVEDRYLAAARLLYDLGRCDRAVALLRRGEAVAEEMGAAPSSVFRDLERSMVQENAHPE